jgi:hypothetical protein
MPSNVSADTMTLETRLGRLEETVRTMIGVLRQETDAVKAIDLETFAGLQKIKGDLFDVYQADIKTLLSRKNELKTMPEPVKERIRHFERDLSVARTDNMSALDRAGKSFLRLRDRIVHIARDTALRNGAQYGANGMLAMRTNRAISTGHQDQV